MTRQPPSDRIEGVDPGPTGLEAYRIVAEELDGWSPAERAAVLADLDPRIVERARAYAKRAHKRWTPRPVAPGWYLRRIG
jgi:hypothetical protein